MSSETTLEDKADGETTANVTSNPTGLKTQIWHMVRGFNPRTDITVEPVMYLYYIAEAFFRPTNSALYYRKSCMSQFDDNTCDHLTEPQFKDEEDKVQKMASQWEFYDTLSNEVIGMVVTIIYGSLSDRYTRKLPLMLPPLAQVVSCSMYLVNAVYIRAPLGLMLVGPIFSTLMSGGTTSLLMAAFSYLSDATDPKSRTVRCVLIYGGDSVARLVGYLISGVMLDKSGFVPVYCVSLIFYAASTMFVVVWIKDIMNISNSEEEAEMTCCQTVLKEVYQMKDSFLCVVKKRENHGRLHVIQLYAIIFTLLWFSAYHVIYVFLRHSPLSFTQSQYGIYQAILNAMSILGLLVIVPVAKKMFHVRDTVLIVLSLVSSAAYTFFLGVSTVAWMVYISPVLGCMSYCIIPCVRSILSKSVNIDEQGKIFAVLAILENIGSVLASAMYSSGIYPATVNWFPGFSMVLSAVLYICPVAVAIWLHIDMPSDVLVGQTIEDKTIILDSLDEKEGQSSTDATSATHTYHSYA